MVKNRRNLKGIRVTEGNKSNINKNGEFSKRRPEHASCRRCVHVCTYA